MDCPVKLQRRISIFDITLPFAMGKKQAQRWYDLLNEVRHDQYNKLSHIEDITPSGQWVTGKTRYIRVSVDSRFVTDEEITNAITEAIHKIR